MSVKKIILLSLTGFLIVVHIFQLYFEPHAVVKEIKPNAAVTTLGISNHKGEIRLSKNGDDWVLNSNHPANREMAAYLLSTFENLKIIETVKKSATDEELDKYGLNNPIIVTGYSSNNEQIQKLFIGKTTSTANQTYIKLDSSKEVYLASGNLILAFDFAEENLLDYTLYSFKTSEAYKIQKYNGKVVPENLDFIIEKTGEVAETKWACPDSKINETKIEGWLRSVESLTASEWIDDFESLDMNAAPDLVYIISAAGKDIKIEFYGINEDKEEVIVRCSESNDFPCLVSKSKVEKYLKSISDFE